MRVIQVITIGISFLGAGTISRQESVKGLTIASILVTSVIGIGGEVFPKGTGAKEA